MNLPTTEDMWKTDSSKFIGDSAKIRAVMDYTYFRNYVPERQAIQDAIVDTVLQSAPKPSTDRPWMVVLGGPMGAGKTHTMHALHATGQFALDEFLVIDCDIVKSMLPECDNFVQTCAKTAGTRLHKESLYIVELLERTALNCGISIVVHTSLRDAEWYAKHLEFVRDVHPQYRIVLVLIQADLETIYKRVYTRGQKTGRHVPDELVRESFEKAPISFGSLRSMADISCTITNQLVPIFSSPEEETAFVTEFGCAKTTNPLHTCDVSMSPVAK
jgi:ribose 1,5-bisphosphokinase PhnN